MKERREYWGNLWERCSEFPYIHLSKSSAINNRKRRLDDIESQAKAIHSYENEYSPAHIINRATEMIDALIAWRKNEEMKNG